MRCVNTEFNIFRLARKANKGFTLIELLVVISIISLLSSVVLGALNSARSKARDTKRIAELKQVQNALELYRNDFGTYPTSDWTSSALWQSNGNTALVANKYMQAMPVDPQSGQSVCTSNDAGEDICMYQYYNNSAITQTCGGRAWNTYTYVITFGLENDRTDVPKTGWNTSKYCLHGSTK